jgi:multidrug efflux system membrane fusion protein
VNTDVTSPGKQKDVPPGTSAGPSSPPSGGRLAWKIILILLIIAGIAVYAARRKSQAAAQSSSSRPGAGGRGGGNFPVSVVVGTVAKQDVPIYLDGLGTVQAFNTVTVRSRVDGQIQKIAFTEGQDVHEGDLLAQIDPEPLKAQLAQAVAKKGQDEAQLANARIDLSRQKTLLEEKIVAPDVYDTAKYLAAQLEASVKSDQAAIDNATVQLAYTTINAPIGGRTGIRQVDQGNIVHATDANGIVVVTQLRPISIVFTLPEQYLSDIRKEGDLTNMIVVAVDRDNSTSLDEGKLAVIDNQIDTTTGTIRLKATFPNKGLTLWPGQFVNARLLLKLRKDALVVPASVVQRGPDGSYAFVVKEDKTVEMRPIKVARIEKDRAVIDQGLAQGEQIVVDGQYKLQPGSTIKPATADTDTGGKPQSGTNSAGNGKAWSGKHGSKGDTSK